MTQINGTTGADGASGAVGSPSPDLATVSGDGGDGANAGSGSGVSITLAQEDVAADSDYRLYGGHAGNGGNGGYAGDLFQDHQAVRTGDHEVQNDYFSNAGAGGDGGDGGDGGSASITASGLTFVDGVTLISASSNGGYGGAGSQGGAGATDIHNTVAAWQTYTDEENVEHTVSLDYTSHGASGGNGGDGGDGGTSPDGTLNFTGNAVHQSVWLVAQGGNGGFGLQGGNGGAGNDPAVGGLGGHGGNGGDGLLTVDSNSFDFSFASNITFTAWGGNGGVGGLGGSGGYGMTAEGIEGTYDIDYTYAMAGNGGDGGDAGAGTAVITNNQFLGGDFNDKLTLSIHLNSGAVGDGGQGGIGAFGNTDFDGGDGADGASANSSLTFDGNVIDGEGSEDTLELLVWNLVGPASDTSGLNLLPALDINLYTGTLLVGEGVNAIDDIEDVSVFYANGNYGSGSFPYIYGDVTLTGNNAINLLTTSGGNDRIDGGAGADDMRGGAGDDTYYVDDAGDRVVEFRDSGWDTVHSTISISIAGQYIEAAVLDGSGNINISGNSLDNTLTGNAGDNRMNGAVGADSMAGGAGDDWYFADNAGDTVWENENEGWDTISATVSVTLGDNVEALVLTGSHIANGTGNALGNSLVGNYAVNVLDGGDGDDTIAGGGGNDTLTGGDGADRFVFEHFGQPNGADTLTDFASGTDHLVFTASDFGFSAGHVLTGAELVTNLQSGSGGQFIFNTFNHRLYWDGDGTGGGAPVTIAILNGVSSLTAADFSFV